MIDGNLLGEAHVILQNTALSEETRSIWMASLMHANTTSLQLFISLFKNDTSEIERASNWLRLKLKAYEGDREAAKRVGEEEREEIKKALQEE